MKIIHSHVLLVTEKISSFITFFFDRSQGGMHIRTVCPTQQKQEAINQRALSETILPMK